MATRTLLLLHLCLGWSLLAPRQTRRECLAKPGKSSGGPGGGDRLHQLDKHCQSTALQLVELLSKQNQLYKEKQMLTEEADFLRTQLPQVPKP